jgi:hypothetical protein
MRTRNQKIKKLPKLSKALPYPGKPVEQYQHSKLYKCWYCGHVNTVGREKYDDGRSSMHTTLGMSYTPSRGDREMVNPELAMLSVPRNMFGYRVAPRAGADGTPMTVKNVWSIVSYNGCPSCGTMTWGPGAARGK